jgi:hypothetical protein
MESLKLEKKTAKKLYPEAPVWFRKILDETFSPDLFKKRSFDEIKTFEDACEELGIENISSLLNENDTTDEIAYKKLKVIVRAINQGWEPDWSNTSQKKWWPWFILSSGFGFSRSLYYCACTNSTVGSRLCFESEKKSDYAAKQFIDLYEQFLTIKK